MDETEAPRTKPFDVALAEAIAWRQGLDAARAVLDAHCDARYALLKAGFPPTHALCEELDGGAGKWAAHADQMRRDMIEHCKLNHLDIPVPRSVASMGVAL